MGVCWLVAKGSITIGIFTIPNHRSRAVFLNRSQWTMKTESRRMFSKRHPSNTLRFFRRIPNHFVEDYFLFCHFYSVAFNMITYHGDHLLIQQQERRPPSLPNNNNGSLPDSGGHDLDFKVTKYRIGHWDGWN